MRYSASVAFEIELKAWVDDYDRVRQRLEQEAVFAFQHEKTDMYWRPRNGVQSALPASGLRLRREIQCASSADNAPVSSFIVTYKTAEQRTDIELNAEHEFSVSGSTPDEAFDALTGLFSLLGLEPAYTKKKTGISYRAGDITAELSTIEHLGQFVELEILSRSNEPELVSAARQQLLAFLEKIGIDRQRIEMKYYSEMLKERGFA